MIIKVERTIRFEEITFKANAEKAIKSLQPSHREEVLDRVLGSSSGMQRIAAAMTAPVRSSLDYQSIARRIFQVESLDLGETPIYDTDFGRITVPIESLAARTEVSDFLLHEQRFPVLDRARQALETRIRDTEDARAISLLTYGSREKTKAPNLTAAMVELSNQRMVPANLLIHPSNAVDVVRGNAFQFPTRSEEANSLGSIYGAEVIASTHVPRDTHYLLAQPSYVGRFAIRQPLEVIINRDARGPLDSGMSIIAHESVGMAILNDRAFVPINVEAH